MLNIQSIALCLLLSLLVPWLSWAGSLTEAQYQIYNNDVLVVHQAEFATPVANKDWQAITDAYNSLQAPTYWVWKTSLSEKSVYEDTSPDGSVWNWTTYIGQSVQERDGWARMYNPGPLNPSLPQVRDAYTKIFGGTGASATQRAHLLSLSRRPARRIEVLFIQTGSGDGSAATPAVMVFEGQITYTDTAHAIGGVPLP